MILDARERLGDEGEADKGPRLRDYSPAVERLDRIVDGLAAVSATIIASQGGHPPKIHPSPRPFTEFEGVKLRRQRKRYDSLVSRALRKQRPQR